MTTHHLEPDEVTLHGTFSPRWEPVLMIDPGDTVIVRTLDARGSFERPHTDGTSEPRWARSDPERANGHALCGPIAVRNARAGMTLVVEIGPITVGTWGWTSGGGRSNGINEHLGLESDSLVLNWDLDRIGSRATNQFGQSVRLAPFFGVMGMPGKDETPVPSWTPRPQGGNLDCKELVSGSRLYLPIAVDGALFSVGDGHAAQGDGEASSTGIECPMESAELTFNIEREPQITGPLARTPGAWITFGFDEVLDTATLKALDGMLDLFEREFGISRANAIGLISVAVDLRITQIVNGVRGVHAVLRHDAIGGLN